MKEKNIEPLEKELAILKEELIECKDLIRKHIVSAALANDKWLSIKDLINYLPDQTARATIYGWVSQGLIPHHKYGKKLVFLKSEIDYWLYNNTSITPGINNFDLPNRKIEQFR